MPNGSSAADTRAVTRARSRRDVSRLAPGGALAAALPDGVQPPLEAEAQRVGLVVVGEGRVAWSRRCSGSHVPAGSTFAHSRATRIVPGSSTVAGTASLIRVTQLRTGSDSCASRSSSRCWARASMRWCWSGPVGLRSESGVQWAARQSSMSAMTSGIGSGDCSAAHVGTVPWVSTCRRTSLASWVTSACRTAR